MGEAPYICTPFPAICISTFDHYRETGFIPYRNETMAVFLKIELYLSCDHICLSYRLALHSPSLCHSHSHCESAFLLCPITSPQCLKNAEIQLPSYL